MAPKRNRVFQGIDASPGICVGMVHLVDRRQLRIPKLRLHDEQIQEELARFREAVSASIEQLEAMRKKIKHRRGHEPSSILQAHMMMMRDETLLQGTEKLITQEAINAEWALQRIVAQIRQVFDSLEDHYFRERRSDVEFVGQRIMRNLMGHETDVRPPRHEHAVIVAHKLSPADTVTLGKAKVAGFATEAGGKASHTAIIARSMELPAVLGVEGLLSEVMPGDRIIIDGYRGQVILNPSVPAVREALARSEGLRHRAEELISESGPARTQDGKLVLLSANMEMVEEVTTALRHGAEGVGLFRTEFMFMGRRPPTEGFQRRCYQKILHQMDGRPVTIRTIDLGGEKKFPGWRGAPEANPALGLRAIRFSLRMRKMLLTQLRALLRASTEGRLKILFPMVCCHEELVEVLELVEEAKQQLLRRSQAFSPAVEVGVMIEVPAAAVMSASFAKKVDFLSIGTNDLIQFALAVDRHNEQVAYLYNPLDPAVLRLLRQVVENAHAAGIPVSLCGEMAGDPLYLHIMLGLWIDEISMNPPALPYARHLIRSSHMEDARVLTERLLELEDAKSARGLMQQWMSERFPDFFTATGHADILGGL